MKAAIYARISKDRTGASLGVERQEQDCRELAEKLGWEVVAVYVDNDISAHSGARRPQYEAMLRAVKEGQIGAILAWHSDRLHRRTMELEEFVSVAEAHAIQVQTVSAGEVDLSTPSGRMVARMLGAAAQHEVDHARERMRRAKAQAVADGRYRGGMRPYGFEADGMTVRDDEAKVISDMTQGVLADRSLSSLARQLNEQGHKTSTGREWTYNRLRDVLMRPRNAGLLHSGRPTRNDFQVLGYAKWPAIVDEDTWRAVHAILAEPSRRVHANTEARWLGSHTYLCGREGCGSLMRPTSTSGSEPGSAGQGRRYHYRCAEQNHLSIAAVKTDNYVRDVVTELVRDPRIVAALTQDPGEKMTADRERRATLAARLAAFENDYAAELITGQQLAKATKTVTDEMEQLDARLASGLQTSAASQVMREPDPGAAFRAAPIDVQRAVLRTVLSVTVKPVAKRGQQWTSDRLVLAPIA